jgi:competence protein ComEA
MSATELPAARRFSPAAPSAAPSAAPRRALSRALPFPPGPAAGPPPPALPLEWERIRRYAGGALLALCFALFGWQVWRGRAPAPVLVDVTAQPAAQSGAAEVRVHVTGAVAAPGVYRLTAGDRVEDAVRAAGGFAAGADDARVNLAQRVRDEQRLDVPAVGQAPPDPDPGGPAEAPPRGGAPSPRAVPSPSGGLTSASLAARDAAAASAAAGPPPGVNVNTATAAELEALPGIGEVTARRILEYRQAHGRVRSLEELQQAGIPGALLRRAAGRLVFE